MDKLSLSHTTIAYECLGQGTPLVLLHGYPLDHHIWEAIIPLLDHYFELIIPDLRGFGQSRTSQDDYSLSDMAKDVYELTNQLGKEKIYIAGHSMGGYVALAFARSYPGRIRGLGLISSQAIADTPEKREARYTSIKQVEESGVEVVAINMTGKLTSNARLHERIRKIISDQPASGIKNALKALAERPDQTSLLKGMKVPLLVIHGESDQLISYEQAVATSKEATTSKLILIPNSGHMPMLEEPDVTAAGLKWFI